jgi:phosphoribosylamine--glycine ligase
MVERDKRVFVIGSGGREHALVYTLLKSPQVAEVYCSPGNAGIAAEPGVKLLDYKASQIDELAKWAVANVIDLTVVGPEDPLVAGIADKFAQRGLRVFGPSKSAAILEGSKVFAKDFMFKYGIPTAEFGVFNDPSDAKEYVKQVGAPIVIKADGLAAGKGVIVSQTYDAACNAIDEMMVQKKFGDAGNRIVVEEFLPGVEASITAVTDGKDIKTFSYSQDHKAIFDNDEGPNTGGMGAYAPTPFVDDEMAEKIEERILRPSLRGIKDMGLDYRGFIYQGLMLVEKNGEVDPHVLEWNVRLGDPEGQPVLALLDSDLYEIMTACLDGNLKDTDIVNRSGAAACVVMASQGYPEKPVKGKRITFDEELMDLQNVKILHAGTAFNGAEGYVTNGGRVLGVTAYGKNHREAIDRAYSAVDKIHWEGEQHRRDIGQKALR